MSIPMKDIDCCIVIPCFNEAGNFLMPEYHRFLKKHPNTLICFVNDGSTDTTLNILMQLHQQYPKQIEVLSYEKNQGKAEAVRKGILHTCYKFEFPCSCYLDADLAVSLEECYSLRKHLNEKINFCFGSRILKLGSTIERKRYRFLIGRAVATLISMILGIKVYDTQCGCKLFSASLAKKLFASPFISRWLFDVELFFRMIQEYGREKALTKMVEIPLIRWQDRGDSKVKVTYFFSMFKDLYKIRKRYHAGNVKNADLNLYSSKSI